MGEVAVVTLQLRKKRRRKRKKMKMMQIWVLASLTKCSRNENIYKNDCTYFCSCAKIGCRLPHPLFCVRVLTGTMQHGQKSHPTSIFPQGITKRLPSGSKKK